MPLLKSFMFIHDHKMFSLILSGKELEHVSMKSAKTT